MSAYGLIKATNQAMRMDCITDIHRVNTWRQSKGLPLISPKGPSLRKLENEFVGVEGTEVSEPTCGDCGKKMTLVRPGKYQCDNDGCLFEKKELETEDDGPTGLYLRGYYSAEELRKTANEMDGVSEGELNQKLWEQAIELLRAGSSDVKERAADMSKLYHIQKLKP